MSTQGCILLYGSDVYLLELRRLVLLGAMKCVEIASRAEEINQLLEAERVAVLVLCHTLPEGEYEWACALARKLHPEVALVSLVGNSSSMRRQYFGEVVGVAAGPQVLLDAVERSNQERKAFLEVRRVRQENT